MSFPIEDLYPFWVATLIGVLVIFVNPMTSQPSWPQWNDLNELRREWRSSPLYSGLYWNVVATLIVYVFSVMRDRTSVFDPYWMVAPVIVSGMWSFAQSAELSVRAYLALTLLIVWAVRLTANFYFTWHGLARDDFRYDLFRRLPSLLYWLVSLTGLHLFPTLVVYGCTVPLYFTISAATQTEFGYTDFLAYFVTTAGILIESVADIQLHTYRKVGTGPGICDVGLWGVVRHPNYLGEMLHWWGQFLFAWSATGGFRSTLPVLAWIGPVSLTLLFVCASIPMMTGLVRAATHILNGVGGTYG